MMGGHAQTGQGGSVALASGYSSSGTSGSLDIVSADGGQKGNSGFS